MRQQLSFVHIRAGNDMLQRVTWAEDGNERDVGAKLRAFPGGDGGGVVIQGGEGSWAANPGGGGWANPGGGAALPCRDGGAALPGSDCMAFPAGDSCEALPGDGAALQGGGVVTGGDGGGEVSLGVADCARVMLHAHGSSSQPEPTLPSSMAIVAAMQVTTTTPAKKMKAKGNCKGKHQQTLVLLRQWPIVVDENTMDSEEASRT
ncbi:hypothetical protein E2562_014907 [Oryza meyeriana var. granulata]|uniref:DUF834 domain-containing protein n=1 Tax=Oryza meyeriana var. granulata TaxID=110450 RepID=A0A6G1EJF3_9ORYZ|nr:hypothetical protein E2562_014907 [Oryza meyeriana var. granulata]